MAGGSGRMTSLACARACPTAAAAAWASSGLWPASTSIAATARSTCGERRSQRAEPGPAGGSGSAGVVPLSSMAVLDVTGGSVPGSPAGRGTITRPAAATAAVALSDSEADPDAANTSTIAASAASGCSGTPMGTRPVSICPRTSMIRLASSCVSSVGPASMTGRLRRIGPSTSIAAWYSLA